MGSLSHTHQDISNDYPSDDSLISDPWESTGIEEGERRDSWLLNYVDILTLVLTLFVLLLALQPKEPATAQAEVSLPLTPVDAIASLTPTVQKATMTITEDIASPIAIETTAPENVERLTTPPQEALIPTPAANPSVLDVMPPWWHPMEGWVSEAQPWSIAEPIAPMPTVSQELEIEPVPTEENTATPQESEKTPASPVNDLAHRIEAVGLADRIQISPLAQGARLEIRDNILFTPGNTDLTPTGQTMLNELAHIFTAKAYSISVEGHTDDKPIHNSRFPSNWELSTGRASQVARYLIGHGIGAERLQAVGYADTRPVSDNLTVEGRTRNRRVSLVLEIPKTGLQ